MLCQTSYIGLIIVIELGGQDKNQIKVLNELRCWGDELAADLDRGVDFAKKIEY